jgi:short-subunit dehydrogenase
MKRVLVTGATSGLGREIAVQLARRGWQIALSGRRPEKLKEAAAAVREAGGEALELLGAVDVPEDVKNHHAKILEAWGGVDWAILNAGVGDSQDAREFSAENVRWTMDINVMGAAYWLEALIPGMIAQGAGKIAGVSSIAGFRGLPKAGAYCASKAALTTLLESTRVDLRDTGVEVLTVCPGFVKSELTDRNDPRDMLFLLETTDGASRIIRGIEAGRKLIHFPWQLSMLMIYIVHNLPNWLYDVVIRRGAKRRKKPYVDPQRRNPPSIDSQKRGR